MMITFYPTWLTPSGNIANVTVNQSVSVQLNAIRQAQFMGSEGTNNIFNLTNIDNTISNISNVLVNTIPTDFQIIGNSLVFANSIANDALVQVFTSDSLTYTLLHDNLPSGVSLSNTGNISGTAGYVSTLANSQTYTFAVRVSDGYYVRDREFNIIENPANTVINPPGWGANLPTMQPSSDVTPFLYIPLGSSARSTLFTYQLDLFEPNNIPPTLVLQDFLGAPDISAPFNTIPPGLSVDSRTGLISGIVAPNAIFGTYYFNIMMEDYYGNPITDGTGSEILTFQIIIEPSSSALQPFRLIIWNTPAGSIATMAEGQIFPLSVNAICTTGEAVTYTLVDGSELPPGLSLNSTTGDIEGVLAHVASTNTTFNFTIRANVLNTIADRTFSITVIAKYSTGSFINFNFKLRMNDSIPMAEYYANTILTTEYFRENDSNFGILGDNSLLIYIVGGLSGTVETVSPIIRASEIDAPISLQLGDHKVANATINGNVVYQVLYRDIIDPIANAGGYILSGGIPVQQNLLSIEGNSIYPDSLNNIRDEFILSMGFPSIDPTMQYVPGISGSENLPLWMSCPQVGTDTSTAIGFIPAMVIAYIQPETGQNILNRIAVRATPVEGVTDPTDPIRNGHIVDFDQYYVAFDAVSDQTIFDNNTTTFDSVIIFDEFAYTGADLFRINRSTNNTTS